MKTSEPKTLTDFPEYVEAAQKLRDLKAQLAEISQRINDTSVGLARPANTIVAEATAFLDGKDASKASNEALLEQLGALQHQQRVLIEAIALQKKRLEAAREVASREVCKTLLPTWRKFAEEIKTIGPKLADAGDRQREFLNDLEHQGICTPQEWKQSSMLEATTWQLRELSTFCDQALRA